MTRDFNKSLLNMHMSNGFSEGSTKPILWVFKGFPLDFFQELSKIRKLLTADLTWSLQKLASSKGDLLREVIMQSSSLTKGERAWMTFEEFVTVTEDNLKLFFDIRVLTNNLYHDTFPCLYEIEGREGIFETYFKDLQLTEGQPHPDFEIFDQYYGDLKQVGEHYYVTYQPYEQQSNFYTDIPALPEEQEVSIYDSVELELSEDENEFLRFTDDLLSGLRSGEVRITYSGDLDNYPFRLFERLAILQALVAPQAKIQLCTKFMESKDGIDEGPYLEILNRYWGYDSFRDLRVYRNVNDPDMQHRKETFLLSQAQVIDDIVTQSDNATENRPYQDVFVTSPTGAGKSLMFQIPAIYLAEKKELLTIVISPLIGLMADQVEGLHKHNVDFSATINSDISPIEKLEIIEKVQSGKISILYISPETLLSRADIQQLIGDRRIGLFVIDEAHIVTTWGKAFRADYWYLGSYLQRLRKEHEHPFPIATFTATAIYGGMEDMYQETRDSLYLINPINYFGYIKRDDLEVQIQQSKKDEANFGEYLRQKFYILLRRAEQFLQRKEKTLVYFPTVRLIEQFQMYLETDGSQALRDCTVQYYGKMDKEKKNESYLKFLNGDAKFMLATKAFGMGIDISDIHNVYHFAPTGNVCDYIQEIGRAARKLDRGYAYFDFLPKDFVHVNRLHGISTIRKQQLVQVLEKVLQLVKQSRSRNLLVSADEFRYIFDNNGSTEDIDNKLKTALLILEKDYRAKMTYSPIIARPRSIFAKEYLMVHKDHEVAMRTRYGAYMKAVHSFTVPYNMIYNTVYQFDLKKLWEDKFRSLSFPQFKHYFHTKHDSLRMPLLEHVYSVFQLELEIKTANVQHFRAELKEKCNQLGTFFGKYARNNSYFSIKDLAGNLQSFSKKSSYTCENLATVMMISADNYDRLCRKQSNFYQRFLKSDEAKEKFYLQTGGYASFLDWIQTEAEKLITHSNVVNKGTSYELYLSKQNKDASEKIFVLLGLLEAMGLLMYRVNGGVSPEISIRVNTTLHLERVVKNPARYRNYILDNVRKRHKLSVAMLEYLFTREVDTDTFWEHIENYFLGTPPAEVLHSITD